HVDLVVERRRGDGLELLLERYQLRFSAREGFVAEVRQRPVEAVIAHERREVGLRPEEAVEVALRERGDRGRGGCRRGLCGTRFMTGDESDSNESEELTHGRALYSATQLR